MGVEGLKGDKTPRGENSSFDPCKIGSGLPLEDHSNAPLGNRPKALGSGVVFPESLRGAILLGIFGLTGGGGGIIPRLTAFSAKGFVKLDWSELRSRAATPDKVKRDDPGAGDLWILKN